jgi:hypothetical protein
MSVRLREFEYDKGNGQRENRRVLVLKEGAGYIEGIDLSKLDKAEADAILKADETVDDLIKQFTAKAFRRFKTDKITL